MKQTIRPLARWITLMVFLWLVLGQALALAEGPVSIEVDKAKGTEGTKLEAPVQGATPDSTELQARKVEQPASDAKLEEKKHGWLYTAGNWLVEALTGVGLEDWAKPQRLGYNILNALLELATGTGIEKWKTIGQWGVGDWLWMIGNVALTIFTFGGGSLLKSLGVKLLGPVGKFITKLLKPLSGPVFRFMKGLIKPGGKLLAKLTGPVLRFFTVGRGGVIVRRLSRGLKKMLAQGLVLRFRQFGSKAILWMKAKGFTGLAKYIEPNPFKNQLVKDVFGWVAKTRAWKKVGDRLTNSFLGRTASTGAQFVAKCFQAARDRVVTSRFGKALTAAVNWVGGLRIRQFTLKEIAAKSGIGLKDLLKATVKRDPLSLITDGLPKLLTAAKDRLTGTSLKWANRIITFLKIREEADAAKKIWERGKALITGAASLWAQGVATAGRITGQVSATAVRVMSRVSATVARFIVHVSNTATAVITAVKSTAVSATKGAIRLATGAATAIGRFGSKVIRSAKQRYRERPRLAR